MRSIHVDLNPKIKRLEIPMKKATAGSFTGGYRSVFKGKGMEFDRYRAYVESDDAHLIDWKASLKSRQMLVKVYEEEKNINIFFLFDVSDSMLFGSTPKLKCEYAAEAVASTAFAVTQAGDAVGIAMFNDNVIEKIPPMAGKKQYFNIVKLLENPKFYGGKFDFEEAIKFAIDFLPMGSLLIIVSDFIGLSEKWEHYIKIASQRFDLIGMMVSDPRDRKIPKGIGQVMIQDPYSGEKMVIGSRKMRVSYERDMEERMAGVRNVFLKVNGFFDVIRTEEPLNGQLLKFFRRREKEWT